MDLDEKDVVKVLQHYRHDLMNNLQMVHGYLSMGKMDKVADKVKDCLKFYNEERKLMSLNAPKFALWLIQFNHVNDNFRITYQVHTENKKLDNADDLLVKLSNAVINECKITCNKEELYEIHLELKESPDLSHIEIRFLIEGSFGNLDNIKIKEKNVGQMNKLQVRKTSKGKLYHFQIPCNT